MQRPRSVPELAILNLVLAGLKAIGLLMITGYLLGKMDRWLVTITGEPVVAGLALSNSRPVIGRWRTSA